MTGTAQLDLTTGAPPEVRLQALRQYLSRFRFSCLSEDTLQRGIAGALAKGGIAAKREYHLDHRSRLDFMLPGGIVIEVKVDGSRAEVMRQVSRYAQSPQVSAVLLVTTRASHTLPDSFNGKPVAVHSLISSLL